LQLFELIALDKPVLCGTEKGIFILDRWTWYVCLLAVKIEKHSDITGSSSMHIFQSGLPCVIRT